MMNPMNEWDETPGNWAMLAEMRDYDDDDDE